MMRTPRQRRLFEVTLTASTSILFGCSTFVAKPAFTRLHSKSRANPPEESLVREGNHEYAWTASLSTTTPLAILGRFGWRNRDPSGLGRYRGNQTRAAPGRSDEYSNGDSRSDSATGRSANAATGRHSHSRTAAYSGSGAGVSRRKTAAT